MSEPTPARPPTPRPAERAKSIAVRGGPASLLPALGHDARADRTDPVLWHLHRGDDVSIVLPTDTGLAAAVHGDSSAALAVTLEITDEAPVRLRQPVRGLLWLTGWLRGLDEAAARARALAITDHGGEVDPRLLDLGHGLGMVRFTPVSVVLSDSEGTHSMSPVTFDAAPADPFCTYETHWLRHLETDHADVMGLLRRHLPPELHESEVRALGLDRHGLRLRVEAADDDHDVRIAFSRSVDTPPHLALELRKLLGCPFLSRFRQDS